MISASFKKTLYASIFAHLVFFSLFSFSFGINIPLQKYASVNFLGGLFNSQQMNPDISRTFFLPLQRLLTSRDYFLKPLSQRIEDKDAGFTDTYYMKPHITLTAQEQKTGFSEGIVQKPSLPRREKPPIILHPLLPYDFILYFKDRQSVHVELDFRIISGKQRNSLEVKRKISSGNLEVDLLSMRYIGHYLFIEQAGFAPNSWQSVKIDLSAQDD